MWRWRVPSRGKKRYMCWDWSVPGIERWHAEGSTVNKGRVAQGEAWEARGSLAGLGARALLCPWASSMWREGPYRRSHFGSFRLWVFTVGSEDIDYTVLRIDPEGQDGWSCLGERRRHKTHWGTGHRPDGTWWRRWTERKEGWRRLLSLGKHEYLFLKWGRLGRSRLGVYIGVGRWRWEIKCVNSEIPNAYPRTGIN